MKFLTLITLIFFTLSACVKDMEVVKFNSNDSNAIPLVLLNSNEFDNDLRKALASRGFYIPASASIESVVDKSDTQEVSYNKAEARYGLKHKFILSYNNPCFTNSSSWDFTEYTLELIDLSSNELLMLISKGGRTESCPGSFVDFMKTTDLLGDLADELRKNLD